MIPNVTDVTGFANLVLQSVQQGRWAMVAALLVIAAVASLRKWGPAWVATDRASTLFALLTGAAGAVGARLIAGTPMTLSVLCDGAAVALTAIGGYSAVKKILFPSDAAPAAAPPAAK